MGKERFTVELNDATIRYLAGLGKPSEVLARLADSAAAGARRPPGEVLSFELSSTDKDSPGERGYTDSLLGDQREANEQLVRATIRFQESADDAHAAKERAEDSEHELREVAEFRELFIGILGHDLRTPLGAISIAAGVLLGRGQLDDHDRKVVARVVNSTQRMSRLIAQLLDLTRVRLGGGLPLIAKPTDLREVCQCVVDEFEATIHQEIQGDVTGTWDPDRLEEALSNLAGNALEHAAQGTAVNIKAYPDGATVVVEVTNQGKPIPADVLPFIFEPFRRAQQREKSATGNLGLGLYIAKQIVLAHGGVLDGHSAGGATTFVMRLPRHPPPAA